MACAILFLQDWRYSFFVWRKKGLIVSRQKCRHRFRLACGKQSLQSCKISLCVRTGKCLEDLHSKCALMRMQMRSLRSEFKVVAGQPTIKDKYMLFLKEHFLKVCQ